MNFGTLKKFVGGNKELSFGILALLLFGAFFRGALWQKGGADIVMEFDRSGAEEMSAETIAGGASPLSGINCENYSRRPFAVMMAGDPVARPLSGISEADLVVEMPVITGSITRMMAVFVCNSPARIGSVRSSRHDFIPLAAGFGAVFAHWGGSHFALDKLKTGVVENIDALANPYGAFFRVDWLEAPHNGFTSLEKLAASAAKLKYNLETGKGFDGYKFEKKSVPAENIVKRIGIGYPFPYNVEYQYSEADGAYLRFKGNRPEMDKNNNQQVKVKNIVIMRAVSRQIEDQYNDVDVEGEGECQVINDSGLRDCRWFKNKNDINSKLFFKDENGAEISFEPGMIFIEIVQPDQNVDLSF